MRRYYLQNSRRSEVLLNDVMVEVAPYRHTNLDKNGEVARRRQVEITLSLNATNFLVVG